MKAACYPYRLRFNFAAGTSRGVLHEKETWFLALWEETSPEIVGWGECAIFRGLSHDDRPDYAEMVQKVCTAPEYYLNEIDTLLSDWPSIRFGLETAHLDLVQGGRRLLFPSAFTRGEDAIPINGLVWMGKKEAMLGAIHQKLKDGFGCIKLKIGAIDFEEEISLLKTIRQAFNPDQIEIRVDANGAFAPSEAMEKLNRLSAFSIHSIEQPIRQGQPQEMAELCSHSPIAVALDEELIGCSLTDRKFDLLQKIRPQYIILKPALVGGFGGALEWIHLANELGIGWWITSALESNVGLNAIAQWTYTLESSLPQGLGTGQLFQNNFTSPLIVRGGFLYYQPDIQWQKLKF